MKILILHRVPYYKIDYRRGIDHDAHDVTYVGTEERLADLPLGLRRQTIVRPGSGPVGDEVIAAVKEGGFGPFDRVISVSEYELLDAAQVRIALGVPGPRMEDVLRVRDKVLMKESVAEAGLRVPHHARASAAMADGHRFQWAGKTVLKPVAGASSVDVTVHKSPALALAALTEMVGSRGVNPADFELEEFVEGPIIHIDGLVEGGAVVSCKASRYVGTCLSYADGVPLGSVQLEDDIRYTAWAGRCVAAVGIHDGAFHLEAIHSDDGLVFLEIGARVGGADVVDTFELATGIHMPSAELRLQMGERLPVPAPSPRGRLHAWFVFPGHHLSEPFVGMTGLERFRRDPRVVRWNELPEGSRLPRQISYQSREVPAAGILRGRTSLELELLLSDLFRSGRYLRKAS